MRIDRASRAGRLARCFAASVVAATVAAGTFDISAAAAERPIVWALGDSITNSYAPILARANPQWSIVNLARSGETSGKAVSRLSSILSTQPAPEVVVILYGANDIFGSVPTVTIKSNILRMKQMLAERRPTVLVGLPFAPPRPQKDTPIPSKAPPEFLAALAKMYGGYNDLRDALSTVRPTVDFQFTRDDYLADIVHPNAAGAEFLAERAARKIRWALHHRTTIRAANHTFRTVQKADQPDKR